MPMPTTRYGRYLVYRDRALRRARREARRRPSENPAHQRRTSRQREYLSWGKQQPKKYPRYVYGRPSGIVWLMPPLMFKPDYQFFGVIPAFPLYSPAPESGWHREFAVVRYQKRRALSMPSARQREWLPYLFTKEALPPSAFNRARTYPSGAPTYAFLMGWV